MSLGRQWVKVDTGAPLNDDRWHSVRAERNIKEATLRVDAFPTAIQKALAMATFTYSSTASYS